MKRMNQASGIRALAVEFPANVRTNDYYRERYPELLAAEREKSLSRLFSRDRAPATDDPFLATMARYADDPFRGTVERRVLGPGQSAMSIEIVAARRALQAARLDVRDIDLIMASSFLPDHLGVGNAVFLARELGTKCASWNLEATCASTVVALQTACGLVRAGQHRHVLVVASCTYSRVADETDTLSWFLGDGAAAFVVGPVPEREGFLGGATISTPDTCETFYYQHAPSPEGGRTVMRCAPGTGRIIQETAEPYLRAACDAACDRAGVRLGAVDFFAMHTPAAWFSEFVVRALGIDPSKTISRYHRFANCGPALLPGNLHAAAVEGRVRPGDIVMLYAFGGVSAASAALFRWGDVAVAPAVDSLASEQRHV